MDTLQRPAAINPLTFIDRIIADLELTPTQYENAKRSYEAVAEVLNKSDSPIRIYNPKIRPQGSMRIGTTIKPVGRDEFDLDMLCWLAISGKNVTPHEVYEWVWNALGQDETYRKMRERRCRCIRINYAEAYRFHLDVTPAIPDWNKQSDSLYVPDRERRMWCSTHPIGFADTFFKPIAEKLPVFQRHVIESERRFTANAATEPLPAYGAFEKRPLQRIVQMMKHDRDKHYADNPKLIPSSILLTTITAQSYAAEVQTQAASLLEFVRSVIDCLPNYIQCVQLPKGCQYVVVNPTNDSENFAEKWTEDHYNEFRAWHRKLAGWVTALQNTRGKGADVMLTELSARLGKDRVIRAANSVGVDTRALQEAGKVRVDVTGTLGLIGTAIPKTVNFGA